MKAVRWHNARDVRVEEVPEPSIKEGMVKIKVEWCGICGSDLHEYLIGPISIPVEEAHPITGKKAPIIMGHEFSGEVIQIGKGVNKVSVGDLVTVEPIIYCGSCAACLNGYYNICEQRGFYGLTEDGGFSEYVVVKEQAVHKLPDNISSEAGALIEPAAVAFHAVRQSRLKLGDTCVIFGAGPIGLLLLQACKAAGASKIISVEISEERLSLAEKMGATHAIHPLKENTIETIQKITAGGANVCFEATGAESALLNAMESLTMDGEVVIVSVWEKPINFNPNLLLKRETQIRSSIAYRNIFPEIISLISQRKIDVTPIITKKIKLNEIVNEGFESLTRDKSQAKILVSPNQLS